MTYTITVILGKYGHLLKSRNHPTRKMDADRPMKLGGRVIFRAVGFTKDMNIEIRN